MASDLASTLPDLGSPSLPAILGALAAFVGTATSLLYRLPREDVQWYAFVLGFVGTGIGLVIYFFGFLADLY